MRRTLALLAMPVAALAFAGVLFGSQSGNAAVGDSAPVDVSAIAAAPTGLRYVEAGAPVAVTMTNWQETSDASVIVPNGPPSGQSGKR